MDKTQWITAYRCGFCKHIYYNKEFRFDDICPKCGHKNYLDNQWPGNHLEYVLIRKRLFHGWEAKEVEPNMQRKCRIKYTAPKFESDLLRLTQEDESKILELCKDYLAGTWIIVETSKKQKTKYRQLKTIQNKKVGEFYITTYLTDKTVNDFVENISLDYEPYTYDTLKEVDNYLSESTFDKPIVYVEKISEVIEKRRICADGMICTIYQELLPDGTIKIWQEK